MLTARPTIYKGIQMRSRLEARTAAMFDAKGWDWQYEPVCFADDVDQYLPDFLLIDERTGLRSFWEIKGRLDDPVPVRGRMEVIWSSEPEAELRLFVVSGEAAGFHIGARHYGEEFGFPYIATVEVGIKPDHAWALYPWANPWAVASTV
jgi:hypothetical protein